MIFYISEFYIKAFKNSYSHILFIIIVYNHYFISVFEILTFKINNKSTDKCEGFMVCRTASKSSQVYECFIHGPDLDAVECFAVGCKTKH